MAGTGRVNDPFTDLKTALENVKIKSGHTVYLRAGTHHLTANTTMPGAGATVYPFPGEQAVIDMTGAQVADGNGDAATAQNALTLTGAATRFQDVYITSYPLTRVTPARGTYPLGMGRFWISAASPTEGSGYASLKRCIISNVIDVASYTSNAGGVVAEDCIVFDTGWDATSEGDGEHFYSQNASASPQKIFRRCLFGRSYGLAVQLYAESSPQNWHYLFEDITYLATMYASAGQERNDVTYRRLLAWKSWISLGGGDTANTDLVVEDCVVAGNSINVSSSDGTTITGNTVVRLDGVGEMGIGLAQGAITVDNNHYYGNVVLKYDNAIKTWAEWQTLGFDANGTYSADLPTVNAVYVVPSDGAGHVLGQVTIYNWEQDNIVAIDLAALGVTNGQSVVLRSIDDPLGDVRTATVSGTSVSVDMTTRTVSVPHGASESLTPALDIRFGAWRVETV